MTVEEVIALLWKQAREEAIIQLKGLKEHCSEMSKQGEEIWLDDVKALDMGIKALEQEPCEDCISREYMYKLGAKCIAARNKNDELVAIASIESLPSVKQETKWIPVSDRLPEV